MPKIGTKPSFNHNVIKGMSKEDLISMHPDADVEYVVREWEKAKSGNAVAISEVVSDEDLASTVDKAKKEKADKKAKE